MAEVSTVRAKGQVTIPASVRKEAGLEEGSLVEFSVTEKGLLMRPKLMIDPDQAWFWTPEWQAGEREADEDIKAGRTTFFESEEAMEAAFEEFERTGKLPFDE